MHIPALRLDVVPALAAVPHRHVLALRSVVKPVIPFRKCVTVAVGRAGQMTHPVSPVAKVPVGLYAFTEFQLQLLRCNIVSEKSQIRLGALLRARPYADFALLERWEELVCPAVRNGSDRLLLEQNAFITRTNPIDIQNFIEKSVHCKQRAAPLAIAEGPVISPEVHGLVRCQRMRLPCLSGILTGRGASDHKLIAVGGNFALARNEGKMLLQLLRRHALRLVRRIGDLDPRCAEIDLACNSDSGKCRHQTRY